VVLKVRQEETNLEMTSNASRRLGKSGEPPEKIRGKTLN